MRPVRLVPAFALVLAVLVTLQLVRPIPQPVLVSDLPAVLKAAGPPLRIPWPTAGQAALEVAGVGMVGTAGSPRPQPIASLAKVMVALLVLRDHPVAAGATGPSIRLTTADARSYRRDLSSGQSVLRITAGERLSERQLLEGLLLAGANNVADTLARWDAESTPAFVSRMNAEARRLGLRATHYADASGLSPETVSTAADQVRLAEAAMRIPAFREIVAMPQAALPVAGTVYNVDYFLGRGGIVGVKTGATSAAGGCYLAAAYRTVAGRRLLVFAAVLGQRGSQPLLAALYAGLHLVDAAGTILVPAEPVPAGQTLATLTAPWASPMRLSAPAAPPLVAWRGLSWSIRLVPLPGTRLPVRRHAALATLDVTLGHQRVSLTLRAPRALLPPSLWWRLRRR